MSASAPKRHGARRGFTLLEVLVTIALIALLTGVLVVGASRLLGDRPKNAAELFWAAVAETRKDALLNNRDVRLTLDAKTREFVATSTAGPVRLPFVWPETTEIAWFAPKSVGTSSAILVGGQLVETQTLPAVTFYADGTCSPFRVQLRNRDGSVRVLEIDPWTCAPMLAAQTPP